MTDSDLITVAHRIVAKLKAARASGEIFPGSPVSGDQLAAAYNKRFNTNYTSAEIRDAIHHARAEESQPIGSNKSGYWWCISQAEWEDTKIRLLSRIKNQQRAASNPDLFFIEQQSLTFGGGAS